MPLPSAHGWGRVGTRQLAAVAVAVTVRGYTPSFNTDLQADVVPRGRFCGQADHKAVLRLAHDLTFDIFACKSKKTMTHQFEGITSEEYDQLKSAISLITVLIAGADGKIDTKEKEWAEKVTNIRSYTLPVGLKEFYLEVGQDFQTRLDQYIEQYKGETEARNQAIAEKLAELNDIFPKIEDREAAAALYSSLVSFAKHVARASGGFLSWGSVSSHEKVLMSLDMIHPVEE